MVTSVIIIQPPLVQLNGPYPSGAYLSAFFRRLGTPRFEASTAVPLPAFPPSASVTAPSFVRWVDACNLFFHALFSAKGLTTLFDACRADALEKAAAAEKSGDAETAYQLRRYVSMERTWIEWIDDIVSILCAGDRERSHAFVRSPFAPRGARMDAFLASLESDPGPDDARMLATLAIEDLADFITAAFDQEFSLVRYAESIAAGERRFANVEVALARPMVVRFLEPLCEALWQELDSAMDADMSARSAGRATATGSNTGEAELGSREILFCISVPFPGCLVNALAMARSIRRHYGKRAVISMGGGYVNTELRSCENDRLFDYIDMLSFDRGYGGYAAFLSGAAGPAESAGSAGSAGKAPGEGAFTLPRKLSCPPEFADFERDVTASIAPDYSDIDFSKYPRLADDPNPMHRLWSDGTWLKAYLAHGCYWHRCSFCDVSLDYIGVYLPVGIQNLYHSLRRQAIEKRVHGIHLVDEAAPPRALRDFALENIASARSASSVSASSGPALLPFWGNIRFERTFSRDLADFLSAGGLVAVSGGIEIASPEGFKSVDKGIDLANLVAVCAAFKEAGVLVHSYLIYGYWNEDAQGVVDAAETMRQLFAAGLVDSAFWHKFVLTRHSRVYCEYLAGQHHGNDGEKGLSPVDEPGDFAENDLRFRGEKESEKYTAPLDAALRAWMSGDGFDKPVRSWFPFSVPAPKIAKDLVETYIADYERNRDHERNKPCDPDARYFWAASAPIRVAAELAWWHLGEEIRLPADGPLADSIVAALGSTSTGAHREGAAASPVGVGSVLADSAALAKLPRAVFKALRHHGLCRIAPL